MLSTHLSGCCNDEKLALIVGCALVRASSSLRGRASAASAANSCFDDKSRRTLDVLAEVMSAALVRTLEVEGLVSVSIRSPIKSTGIEEKNSANDESRTYQRQDKVHCDKEARQN